MYRLYFESQRLLESLHHKLSEFEATPFDRVGNVRTELQTMLKQLNDSCDRLSDMANKEPMSKRSVAKLKVDQLKYDAAHLLSAVEKIEAKKSQEERFQSEREQLLNFRFKPNSEMTAVNMGDTTNERLQNSSRRMDDLLDVGSSVLENLKNQRSMLKSAHQKLIDLGNNIGLSNTVMRLIEGRTQEDRLILFGGCVATTLIMGFIWKFFG